MNPLSIEASTALSCDALVIGTGAGGATAAASLAAAGRDVLMLEEGPYAPIDTAPTCLSETMPLLWRGGGLTATLGGAPIAFVEGRCVGGGTEINSAIFQRTPDTVLDEWARGNKIHDLSAALLAPFFDRATAIVNASITTDTAGAPTDILARAGEAMHWKVSRLERGRRDGGPSLQKISGFATGAKQSMSATLIPQALSAGARLVANCRVTRLRHEGRRVVGASAIVRGGDGRQHAVNVTASDVFVCAGTTQTPAILKRSGIRSRAGNAFQLHPTLRLLARFPDKIEAHKHHLPLVAITEFMPEMRFGGSVFTLATFGLGLAEDWAMRGNWIADYEHYVMYYVMIRPDGVGGIKTVPGLAEPVVTYRLTERDWRRLGEGGELLAQALLKVGAQRVVPSIRGHAGWASESELALARGTALPRGRTSLMTIHLFGSCPMGSDADYHVTDSFGKLHGMDNVIIADGSVLPGAPGVNPQATIMALALRNVDAFLARSR